MDKCFSLKHGRERVAHAEEEVFHGSGVAQESGGHGEARVCHIADRGLNVIGNPERERMRRERERAEESKWEEERKR